MMRNLRNFAAILGTCVALIVAQGALAEAEVQTEWPLEAGVKPCINWDATGADDHPLDLAQSIMTCAKQDKLRNAIKLRVVMWAKTNYDVDRLDHGAARTALSDLEDAVEAAVVQYVPEKRLNAVVKRVRNNEAEFHALCAHIGAMGPPTYWPDYLPDAGARPKIIPHNPRGWAEFLTDQLECDGGVVQGAMAQGKAQTEWSFEAGVKPCINWDATGADDHPLDLAQSIMTCAKQDKLRNAIKLRVVMMAKARYDGDRAGHRAAWSAAHDLLEEVDVAMEQYQSFSRINDEFRRLIVFRSEFHAVCAHLGAMGPPTYWPDYMPYAGARPKIIPRDTQGWLKFLNDKLDCEG